MTLNPIAEAPAAWSGSYAFPPDAQRAARLDQAVRNGLADSLRTVFESLDPAPRAQKRLRGLLLDFIRAGPVPPGLFGAYIDLVLAVFAERYGEVEALLGELTGPWPASIQGLRIVTLDDRELGQGQSARYRRLLSDDIACEIEPLSAEARANAAARLTQAFDLLRTGAPDVFDELRALIREVVVVAPGAGPAGYVFGGASTFSLWGALVLNADGFGDRLDVAVSLAHEAAHSHLFGLALGGRLVENEVSELYPSPLRRDPRPMEGVVHATYVTARMAYALKALIGSGQLDGGEIARAGDQLAHNRAVYLRGLATVLAHARFTPVGAATFGELRRSMGDQGLGAVG